MARWLAVSFLLGCCAIGRACSLKVGSTLISDNIDSATHGQIWLWAFFALSSYVAIRSSSRWPAVVIALLSGYSALMHFPVETADCGNSAAGGVATCLFFTMFLFAWQTLSAVLDDVRRRRSGEQS